MENPFYINGIVPDEYFCDRERETVRITKTLENNANILLTSPRRMGKTQLIRHVFAQPAIKENYYTFYTDLFPTPSLHEMVLFLSKEIYDILVPKGKTALDFFLSTVRSISGCFTYNPFTGAPAFNLKLGDIHTPELTLQEIIRYLENADKPCIFAIDEFQQIASYPEKNVEALLRSHIQSMNNCRFIFAGSNRHILENMFNSAAKPFYNSAQQMYLDKIPKGTYVDFALRQFRNFGRVILPDAAEYAYDLFDGHTYYVHNILHNAFAYLDPSKTVEQSDIDSIVSDTIREKERAYADIMSQLSYQQKETLVAIAKEGKASGVTSTAFVKKHALKSASSVQYAVANLLNTQLITFTNEGRIKLYSVADRFFEKWICQVY